MMASLLNRGLFRFPRKLMLISGIYKAHVGGLSQIARRAYKIYSTLGQIGFTLQMMFLVVKFFELCVVDTKQALDNLSKSLYGVLLVVKLPVCQSKSMVALLKLSEAEEVAIYEKGTAAQKKIYKNEVAFCNQIMASITVSSFVIAGDLCISGIWNYHRVTSQNKYTNTSFEIPLPLITWYPFDDKKHHFLALISQIFTVVITCCYIAAFHGFGFSLMIFMKAKLKILQDDFQTCLEKAGNQISAEIKIKQLIVKHQKLIRDIEHFRVAFDTLVFLEYSITSFLLALVLLQIISGRQQFFNCIYFLLIYTQIFVLSWNANEIKVQSFELSTALYKSNWYESNIRISTLIKIMIMRTQRPLSLTIGPFGMLTAQDALSRIKLAYSYVTLMANAAQ